MGARYKCTKSERCKCFRSYILIGDEDMRKIERCIIILMLCMLGLTACNVTEKNTEISNDQKKGQEKIDSAAIDLDKVVTTAYGVSERSVSYPTPDSLAEASSEVIYGEIVDMEYLPSMNGGCRTNAQVKVIKSFKGGFSEGDIIPIVLDQGIITVKEYINSMQSDALKKDAREDYQQYSDEDLDNIYYMALEYGDIMAEVGQRNVYFLEKSNYYDTENTCCRVTGPEASYIEISEDCFTKTLNMGTMKSGVNELSTYSIEDNNYGEIELPVYTLDELSNQMNL